MMTQIQKVGWSLLIGELDSVLNRYVLLKSNGEALSFRKIKYKQVMRRMYTNTGKDKDPELYKEAQKMQQQTKFKK